MRVLRLEPGLSASDRGYMHGESYADEIQELAEIRTSLISKAWDGAAASYIRGRAEPHLPVLREYDDDLYREFKGIAEGARVSEEDLLILNHYTDLRDLWSKDTLMEEGCSILHVRHGDEVLLAQTWDMHATAEPFVMMLFLPDENVWVLTITGCLALCGLSSTGLGVAINNLVMADAKVGVSWPTMVRKMLRSGDVAGAERALHASPTASGHHYAMVDPNQSRAWESSGSHEVMVYDGSTSPYVHTNHCLDSKMESMSRISPASTTRHRYAQAERLLAENPTPDAKELWEMMACRDDFPNSLFTDRSSPSEPHGVSTCARILMDCKNGKVWARAGASKDQTPLEFGWDGQ